MKGQKYSAEQIELLKEWGHGKDDQFLVDRGVCEGNSKKPVSLISLAQNRKDSYSKLLEIVKKDNLLAETR